MNNQHKFSLSSVVCSLVSVLCLVLFQVHYKDWKETVCPSSKSEQMGAKYN